MTVSLGILIFAVMDKTKGGRPLYRLHQPFVCRITEDNETRTFVVPENFVTDVASVPRVFLWLISAGGKHARAAVLHDYLYSRSREHKPVTREYADRAFLAGMLKLGVSERRAKLMYRAVRLFGWWAWRNKGDA